MRRQLKSWEKRIIRTEQVMQFLSDIFNFANPFLSNFSFLFQFHPAQTPLILPLHLEPSARSDIKPNRARVVILEVLQRRIIHRLHLKAHSLSRLTRKRRNTIRIPRRHRRDAIIRLYARRVGEIRSLRRNAAQQAEIDGAGAAEGEGRSLELGLRGEEED